MSAPLFILCIKIFFYRIIDVSFMTVRMILSVKDRAALAALMGFLEAVVWFLAVKQAMSYETQNSAEKIFLTIFYGAGFASGIYIGGKISNRFIKSSVHVQIIATDGNEIATTLRAKGYAVTVINVAQTLDGTNKEMLLLEVMNDKADAVKHLVESIDSQAFIVMHETKYVVNGFFARK